MHIDRFTGLHHSDSPAAVAAFGDAVAAVLAHRPAAEALQVAFHHDPDCLAARALCGLAQVLLARDDTLPLARQHLAQAQAIAARRPPTADEATLVKALEWGAMGRFAEAATVLEDRLAAAPGQALLFKLAHSLRFMTGERERMRAVAVATVAQWPTTQAGYGFVLGATAFALEECGELQAAEIAGREAVNHEPTDVWGHHAVGHVMEMQHRPAEGLAWLAQSQPLWSQCNNFARHLGWHLGLFHLERGEVDAALAVYDDHIDPQGSEDFRDVANAVSLLWRMRQFGLPVGDRWAALHVLAQRRHRDCTYLFGTLHHLLTLMAVNDTARSEEVVAALQQIAAHNPSPVNAVGAQVAVALVQYHQTPAISPYLPTLATQLPLLGGSHAQRDVFLRSLIAVAVDTDALDMASQLVRLRRQQRQVDRFHRVMAAQLPVTALLD